MTLYLFPNTLGNRKVELLPSVVGELIQKEISGLIVESDRGGRAFLSLWKIPEVHKFPLAILSKQHYNTKAWDFYLEPILKHKENWGVVSDAGLPCIADPGAGLVHRARTLGIPVRAFSGPCSMTLALMLSGLPAQNFSFLGYLPQSPRERAKYLREVVRKGQTFLCIETPYRNVHTLQFLIDSLPSYAQLCIASDLTGEEEFVSTRSISIWGQSEDLNEVKAKITKVPTVFVFFIPQ